MSSLLLQIYIATTQAYSRYDAPCHVSAMVA